MNLEHILWLFLCFSVLGWVLETTLAAIRTRRYVDRSVLFGPWCIIYGVAGVLIAVGLRELRSDLLFLFLGSAVLATVVEWLAGHLLENVSHTRWWDYSNRRWNLNGYICLSASALWGLLGVVMVKWGNPLLTWLYDLIPAPARQIVLWVLVGVVAVDGLASVLTLAGVVHKLPALENVLAGRHCRLKSGFLSSMLHTPWQRREEKAAVERCMEELEFVGLADHYAEAASSLSYGNQRLLEIARALASDPRLLILDEPAGGMNDQETVALVDTIAAIRDRGITVLLIEHDMRLVMQICEHLVVLENGTLIAQGTPDHVRNHPAVIEAYLGSDDSETW